MLGGKIKIRAAVLLICGVLTLNPAAGCAGPNHGNQASVSSEQVEQTNARTSVIVQMKTIAGKEPGVEIRVENFEIDDLPENVLAELKTDETLRERVLSSMVRTSGKTSEDLRDALNQRLCSVNGYDFGENFIGCAQSVWEKKRPESRDTEQIRNQGMNLPETSAADRWKGGEKTERWRPRQMRRRLRRNVRRESYRRAFVFQPAECPGLWKEWDQRRERENSGI